MSLRFSFRSDKYELPRPIILFEFTRAVVKRFEKEPFKTYKRLEANIQPMCQLKNGLFFSFKEDPIKLFEEFESGDKDHELKLEMTWPIQGLVRIDITNKGFQIAPEY